MRIMCPVCKGYKVSVLNLRNGPVALSILGVNRR